MESVGWEYFITDIDGDTVLRFDGTEVTIDMFGREGWELAAIDRGEYRSQAVAYFKRPTTISPDVATERALATHIADFHAARTALDERQQELDREWASLEARSAALARERTRMEGEYDRLLALAKAAKTFNNEIGMYIRHLDVPSSVHIAYDAQYEALAALDEWNEKFGKRQY